jgi:formylglycine-generating enzyme required for sulfatase activity
VPGFELSATEITVAQYRRCVRAGECPVPRGYSRSWNQEQVQEQHAMRCINWFQAQHFARWVGGELPSMAELHHAQTLGGLAGRKTPAPDYGSLDDSKPVCSDGRATTGVCGLVDTVDEWTRSPAGGGLTADRWVFGDDSVQPFATLCSVGFRVARPLGK